MRWHKVEELRLSLWLKYIENKIIMIMTGRVLFVAVLDPFKTGGGSQATRAYMDAVIEIFGVENVDVITSTGVTVPESYKHINFIFVPQRSKLRSYMLFPFGVLGRFSEAVASYLKNHDGDYDYCIINGGLEAGWCFKHIRNLRIKKVTIHHNQEVKYCMDTKNILTLRGRWPYIVRMVERNAYRYSNYNLFLTQQDLKEMEESYDKTEAKNRLIGTFDYKDAETIQPRNDEKCFHIVASGTMAHYQTTHGILDFYKRYYPIAQRLIPQIKILLTGRNPSEEIMKLEKATHLSIRVSANPENIMEKVQHGRIFLCPTDIGSGLKLRAMDGLKCGLPILVHEVSARGYDAFFEKNYYRIYHDEASFERGLKDILSYLETTPDSIKIINNDYYEYFGFYKGVERFKKALE